MIDQHLADLYEVETKQLNRAVKRNADRFPESFMFQLTYDEWEDLRYQIGTSSSEHGGRRYLPNVFAEAGIGMLASVLRSKTAVRISIQIINAFVQMRKIIADHAFVDHRLAKLERQQLDTDVKIERIFTALESKTIEPDKGIFYDGQIFDAYTFVADLVRKAKTSLVLVDNYVDDTVLQLFTKRKLGVSVTIYTKTISKQLALDVEKHNAQYEPVVIHSFAAAHDRFLIIDGTTLYHIGASLKDLGKKWFAFSKMDSEVLTLLQRLNP